MKKEFGKWFLDLAKYILTAIFLTTYLKGIEGNALKNNLNGQRNKWNNMLGLSC